MTTAAPVRFEEVGTNFGFIPVDPGTNRSYCFVYRLLKECMYDVGSLVLVRGNEHVIQLKAIAGPVEKREKVTIFCQDINDFYPFNFRNKAVGFLIEAAQRSRTGYWFLAFPREGQLAAFCEFLHWVIHGRVPGRRRSKTTVERPQWGFKTPSRHLPRKGDDSSYDSDSDTIGDYYQVIAPKGRRSRSHPPRGASKCAYIDRGSSALVIPDNKPTELAYINFPTERH